MSMLSSKCDRLRKTADKLDEFGKTLWRGRDVLDDATREMRDAADTICDLRNDCVKLMDERDRVLRAADGLADTYRLRGRHYRDLYYDAAAENDKLRKLVLDMCDLLPHADWLSTECDDRASAYIDQAIELGIEVD